MKKSLLFLIPILLVACSRTTPIIPSNMSQEVIPPAAVEADTPVPVQQKPVTPPPASKEDTKKEPAQVKSADPAITDDVTTELDSLIDELTKK